MINHVLDVPNPPMHPGKKKARQWFIGLKSPLWIFWIITILVRVYLVIHTHGIIEGDESIVGIQAQHILRGERPIYFYGLAYLGSVEAYLVAALFLLAGSSVWALRTEPILLSLVVVWLTWRLAHALADRASFSPYTRACFTWSSALAAAVLPLYDLVSELRVLGGYIETFVVMLLLLLSALYLIDRWQAGASSKEIALRWAGIGLLIGLGLWIDPLVVYAIATIAIWIVYGIFRMWRHTPDLILMLAAIPAALVGSAPALYWGIYNNWQNISYIVARGPVSSVVYQPVWIWRMLGFYSSCIAPRVMGGALPIEGTTESELSQFTLYVVLLCIGVTIALCATSYVTRSSLLLQMRRAMALPLLFALSTVALFCTSLVAMLGLNLPCSFDRVGRYASPVLLVLPFFLAITISWIATLLHDKMQEKQLHEQSYRDNHHSHDRRNRLSVSGYSIMKILQSGVFALFLLYLGMQLYTYHISDAGYTFQSPYCQITPANNDPIIAYMKHEHIHYAWATNMVANVITFKTQSQIIAIDPSGVIDHLQLVNLMPAYTEAVQHADRPSILQLVASDNHHSRVLRDLDQEHISYHVARFPSEPGIDVIVVTPLNRTVPVMSAPEFHSMFICQLN